MRRRLFFLLPLAALAACAETPAPVTTEPAGPDPERVYSPGPIAWEQLSDDHRRRARAMLARHQEAVPDDEDALRARWNAMSPAQQRFAIRRPTRMAPPRDTHARRTGSTSRGTSSSASRSSTHRSSTSTSRSGTSGSGTATSRSGSTTSRSGSRPQTTPTPPRPPQR